MCTLIVVINNGETKIHALSETLTLEDTEKGGVDVSGITNPAISLEEGDQLVAATIHLDHLSKDEVLKLIRILEPYDKNLELKTAKDLKAGLSLGDLRLNSKAGRQAPGVKVNGLNGQINAPSLKGGISTPTVNTEMPQIELKDATPNFSHPGLKKPTFGLSTPNLKGAGLDGTFEAPDVSVSTPTLNTPDVSVNVDKPELKTKTPKFKMPTFSLHDKKPKVDGDVNLTAPDLNADLKTPNLNLSAPKINGEIGTPDVDMTLPKAELSGPNLDIETSKANIEAPSGKIKFPKLKKAKTTKVKVPEASVDANLSAPKVNADVSAPNVDIDLPRANLEAPDVDIKTPDVDINAPSGKIKWPKMKKPTFGQKVKAPEVGLDANVSTPDLSLSAPKIDGDISIPKGNVNLPSADVDVKAPDVDINAPTAKHKFSTLKMPKLNLHKSKRKTPDLNAEIHAPDLGMSAPGVDINLPKAELEGPNLDVKTPDLNLSAADLDIKTPAADVTAPDIGIEAPSAKLKKPHVKLPKINLSGPKMKGPDVDFNAKADLHGPDLDLKAPDLSLSAPKVDGKLSAPNVDLNLPNANVKSPNVDLEAPDIDIDAPSSKAKVPHFKLPKFGLSGPRVKTPKLDAPNVDVNMPTAELKAPNVDVKAPDLSVSTPKVKGEISAPSLDLGLPKANLNAPSANIGGNLNSPNLNLSTPEVDLDLPKGPDATLKVPDVDINAPSGKYKMPHFNLPKLNLTGPELDANADLDLSVPKLEGELNSPSVDLNLPKAEVSVPGVNATLPKAEVGTPDLDVNLPKAGVDVDVPTADVDINAPKGKLKFPTLKKFNMSSPKVKSPDVDIAADVSGPDLNLSAPGVGTPDVDMSLPNAGVDVDVPGINAEVEGSKHKVKWPFKWRKSTELKDADINIKAPEVDGTTAEIKLPKNIPLFKSHRLPDSNIDSVLQELTGAVDLSTDSTKSTNDAVVSVSSVKTNLKASSPSVGVNGQTASVDIRERLRLSNTRTTSPDFGISSEPGTPTKVNRGTFKVTKPDADKDYPVIDTTSNEDDAKIALSLNNMLGLNFK
ncbi:hypothetical protein cypCar_00018868 [Cyprinus carpio]|nr:hypothetical protein cypCar_00018868 [Cyprinus carpio]